MDIRYSYFYLLYMIILSHKEFRSVPNMYIDVADNFICLVVSIEFCLKNLHLFRNANPIKIARIFEPLNCSGK